MTKATFDAIVNKYTKNAINGFSTKSGENILIYSDSKFDIDDIGISLYRPYQTPMGPQVNAIMIYPYESIVHMLFSYENVPKEHRKF